MQKAESLYKPQLSLSPESRVTKEQFDLTLPLPPDTKIPEWMLPGTGFNVLSQVRMLENDIREKWYLPPEQVISQWLEKTNSDINGFKLEYLMQGKVLPMEFSIKQIDGQKRISPNNYGQTLWVDIIDENERDGIVKQTIARVEQLLLAAEPGSIVFITSPPGWSGLTDNTGKDFRFNSSQTYIYRKETADRIHGLTVISNMNLEDNEELLEKTSAYVPAFSDKTNRSKIKQVAGSIGILPTHGLPRNFEEVVAVIEEIKKRKYNYHPNDFIEIYQGIKNFDNLWQLDELTAIFLDKFKKDVWQVADSYKELNPDAYLIVAKKLGYTVLELAGAIRKGKIKNEKIIYFDDGKLHAFVTDLYPVPGYASTLEDMQKLPGCAGGGSNSKGSLGIKLTIGISTGMPRMVMTIGRNDEDESGGWRQGICRVCGVTTVVGGCFICHDCVKNKRYEEASTKKNKHLDAGREQIVQEAPEPVVPIFVKSTADRPNKQKEIKALN